MAKVQADLVIVSLHAHVTEGRLKSIPISFVPSFARECIDAGADVFVGHGSHSLLGMELYKGKPIFYGPGNFFAQSPLMERFPGDVYEGCLMAYSLEEALLHCPPGEECFVIGGGMVYRQFMPLADKLYVTWVHKEFEADTYFPEIDPGVWEETGRSGGQDPGPGFAYSFVTYARRK